MTYLLPTLVFLVGLLGFVSLVYGLWQLHPVVAEVGGGALLVWWSWYVSRPPAPPPATGQGGN